MNELPTPPEGYSSWLDMYKRVGPGKDWWQDGCIISGALIKEYAFQELLAQREQQAEELRQAGIKNKELILLIAQYKQQCSNVYADRNNVTQELKKEAGDARIKQIEAERKRIYWKKEAGALKFQIETILLPQLNEAQQENNQLRADLADKEEKLRECKDGYTQAVAQLSKTLITLNSKHWDLIFLNEDLAAKEEELRQAREHITDRWNIHKTEDGLQVCFGFHEKGQKCDYETFVPYERLIEARQEIETKNAYIKRLESEVKHQIDNSDAWIKEVEVCRQEIERLKNNL